MRTWKCRKCGEQNPRRFTRCPALLVSGDPDHGVYVRCPGRKPPKRTPAHMQALNELPYEWWVQEFGERCGICGREPSAKRRLDRDHWHNGTAAGEPRGLLCHRCNRALPSWMTADWLTRAARYLEDNAA